MAKLTKEQILFIENYLIELGVKYWDVRIELIDHIVSEIESSNSNDFEKEVVDITNKLGYKLYTIQKRLSEKTKKLGKQYNKLLLKQMKTFFTTKYSLIFGSIFLVVHFTLYKELTHVIFIKVGLLLFLVSLIINFGITFSQYRKIKESIHIKRASSLLYSPFMIFSIFLYISKPYDVKALIILIIIPIYLFLNYCSYLVYKEVSAKYLKVYKELYAK